MRSHTNNWKPFGLVVAVALLLTGCGTNSATISPAAPRTINADAALTVPIVTSTSFAQVVSNRALVSGVLRGRITSVTSFVTSDDEIYSKIQLQRVDGTSVTYTMFGGTVPGRELSAITNPPIGSVTQQSLDSPVTMTLNGKLVPAVGQEVDAFVTTLPGGEIREVETLVLASTPGGPTYAFSGKALNDSWKPPSTSQAESALLAAVPHL